MRLTASAAIGALLSRRYQRTCACRAPSTSFNDRASLAISLVEFATARLVACRRFHSEFDGLYPFLKDIAELKPA